MASKATFSSASSGLVDLIARARPSVGLALAWVAYSLFCATIAGCLIGPVLLALHEFGISLG